MLLEMLLKSNLLFILVTSLILGCSSNSGDSTEDFTDENGYLDGTYCAEINYYNPNTGTNSTYNLNVEVENNEVKVD